MTTTKPTRRRQKLADLIVEDIKRWIVLEDMAPGDRLPNEKALMERYECAKGTLREALRVLEVEGLITLKTGPGGGAIIQRVNSDPASRALRNFLHFQHVDGTQVYQLRRLVEVEIAASVIGRLDEAAMHRLRDNIAQCQRPHDDEASQRRHRLLELQFHQLLASHCPNPLLRFVGEFLNDMLRDLVVIKQAYKPERHSFDEANVRYHLSLLDAFEARDEARVRRLMHEHMCDAEHHMVALEGEMASQFLVSPDILQERPIS